MPLPLDADVHDADVDWDDLLPGQAQGGAGVAPEETPACQSCRKKKSKCSREHPCSQCAKSGVDCIYEDKRNKGGIKVGVIERLNQRMDTIENMFLGQSMLVQQLIQPKEPSTAASHISNISSSEISAYIGRLKGVISAAAISACDNGQEGALEVARSTPLKKRKREEEVVSRQDIMQAATTNSSNAQDDALQLAPVETTLETYFKLIHPWIPVLHPATFLQRARESNRSEGISLIIQAITVVASPYIPEAVSSVDPVTLERHISQLRQDVMASAIESGTKEAIQALILVAFDSVKRGFSGSPWSLIASICRKIDGLQLNSEEKTDKDSMGMFFSQPPAPLDPPTAWIEVEERRRIFWGAFLLDRFCSIVTGSTPSIVSKSIQRRLPCDGYMWELDQCVETSFFKIHDQSQDDTEIPVDTEESLFPPAYSNSDGPSGVGGFAYSIEATESLYLVTKFHERHPLELDSPVQLSSWLHKFRQLDSRLLQWELCLTHRWREVRVVDGYIDPNLAIAHMTHNAAIIRLHSRLANPPLQTRAWLSTLVSGASKEACVMAAIKIDRIARRFMDASAGVPPHQFALCLFIAGQILLLWKAPALSETATSIITLLEEVSQRLNNNHPDGQGQSEIADPAIRLRDALLSKRNNGKLGRVKQATALPAAQSSHTDLVSRQPVMDMVEFSTMLQNLEASPSSGGSVLGMTFFDQDSPGEASRNMLTMSESFTPNANTASTQSTEEKEAQNLPEDLEFDFMAELRKLESRAREHDRRLRNQGNTQPKR